MGDLLFLKNPEIHIPAVLHDFRASVLPASQVWQNPMQNLRTVPPAHPLTPTACPASAVPSSCSRPSFAGIIATFPHLGRSVQRGHIVVNRSTSPEVMSGVHAGSSYHPSAPTWPCGCTGLLVAPFWSWASCPFTRRQRMRSTRGKSSICSPGSLMREFTAC